MLKTKIALITTLIPSLLITSLHFASHGFLFIESKALAYFDTIKDQAITKLLAYTGTSQISPTSTLSLSEIIHQEAKSKGIKPELIEALIEVESGFKTDAIRFESSLMRGEGEEARMRASSIGLMQIIPNNANLSTCKTIINTWSDLFTPEKNIKCGIAIIQNELYTHKNMRKALMAYNGGPTCVKNVCPQALNHTDKVLSTLAEKLYESTGVNK